MKIEELLKQCDEIEIKSWDRNRFLYWDGGHYIVRDSKDRRKIILETEDLREALEALLHAVEIAQNGQK